jgi:glycosyltransferase involved in cell wall biosynthesis
VRAGLDATPLLGARTGVGQYVHGLLTGLAEQAGAPELVLVLQSLRGALPDDVSRLARGHGWRSGRRLPARFLQRAWARGELPRIELLSGRVDVFHATNFVLPPTRARSVVTVHDLAFLRYPDTVHERVLAYRTLVPRGVRRAQQVVTVSQAVADEVGDELGVEAERLQVIPHGVPPTWFEASPLSASEAAALGLPERFVLFVGNLEPRKNLGTLVAAHRAARESDDATPPLVLAGPVGWGDRWAGSPPDRRHAVLAGYLPDATLQRVVATAAAVCMPSLYEGFGLPVLEALAAGTPVLASDIPAHREVAGGIAALVPPRDEDAWSSALTALGRSIRSPGEERARREHARPFTWSRSAAAHLRTYELACS